MLLAVKIVVPVPICASEPVPETRPGKVTTSERLKASVPLSTTLPTMPPVITAIGANGDAGAYHFIENGLSEGRTTSFDGLDYIASYGDLIKAIGANEQAGASHFITNGHAEGRTTSFDGLDYIAGYTDLMTAFGASNDARAAHFIANGLNEGRIAARFNVAAYESAHSDLIGKYATNDASSELILILMFPPAISSPKTGIPNMVSHSCGHALASRPRRGRSLYYLDTIS